MFSATVRRLALALLLALALPAAPARAAAIPAFDAAAFKAAQEAGKPVLIVIHAEW